MRCSQHRGFECTGRASAVSKKHLSPLPPRITLRLSAVVKVAEGTTPAQAAQCHTCTPSPSSRGVHLALRKLEHGAQRRVQGRTA